MFSTAVVLWQMRTAMITSVPEFLLRPRRCRGPHCGVLFWVCSHCDRGQCYCSQTCRQEGRRQQLRAANRRYQRTEAGRRAHCRRQRTYRQVHGRRRVTHHGSHAITPASTVITPGPPNCVVCRVRSHWIDPFDRFRSHSTKQWGRGRTGASPKTYVFR